MKVTKGLNKLAIPFCMVLCFTILRSKQDVVKDIGRSLHVTLSDAVQESYSSLSEVAKQSYTSLSEVAQQTYTSTMINFVGDNDEMMHEKPTTVVFFPWLEESTRPPWLFLAGWPGVANTESKQIELGKLIRIFIIILGGHMNMKRKWSGKHPESFSKLIQDGIGSISLLDSLLTFFQLGLIVVIID